MGKVIYETEAPVKDRYRVEFLHHRLGWVMNGNTNDRDGAIQWADFCRKNGDGYKYRVVDTLDDGYGNE